ncbi:energy-coupling factor transporter transmembrane component T family protein [Halobacillus aidingensis]|uniref:Energy-coupling factor transport system permease protein n=1 Tax=Halobacillus aidingensis TaxID=240303 RepID=A0A1H0LSX1_HALAD|nr:energy-coupling factor transporter transmembrane component T [Halobacillus aidingensis]SDO71359.1 energy-coupling factor transport system permease protein [Halobacillus aidingensis]
MFLHNVNPTVKALTIIGTVFLLAFVFDPVTPVLYIVWTVIVTFLFGTFKKRYYLYYFIPFTLFAFGMFWTTIVFSDTASGTTGTVSFLGMEFPTEDIWTAAALGLRVLAFASLSLLFLFTTNMVHFILSLIQQLKLPPKIAYGVMAGYRFLPMLKTEFQQIRAAHRIRGVNRPDSWKEKLLQYQRFAIPLLAGAIRKAERTAIAMESKGFTGAKERTFYRPMKVRRKDWLFPVMMFGMLGVTIAFSLYFGYFSWYDGQL